MDVSVSVFADSASQELSSLRNWLAREGELRGRVEFRSGPSDPESMGSITDSLTVGLASGSAVSVLGHALIVWLRMRVSHVKLTVQRGSSKIVVDGRNLPDALALIEQINALERRGETE